MSHRAILRYVGKILVICALFWLTYQAQKYLFDKERFDETMRWVYVGAAVLVVAVSHTAWFPACNLLLIFLSISVISPLIRWFCRAKLMDADYEGHYHFESRKVKTWLVYAGVFIFICLFLWGIWWLIRVSNPPEDSTGNQYVAGCQK